MMINSVSGLTVRAYFDCRFINNASLMCGVLFLLMPVIVRMWYKVMLVASVVVIIISSIMWVVLIGYSVSLGESHTFHIAIKVLSSSCFPFVSSAPTRHINW